MNRLNKILLIIIIPFLLISCAAGPNNQVNTKNEKDKIAGFWMGLWHGIITPVAFCVWCYSSIVDMVTQTTMCWCEEE